jgi:hypothetical protein
MTGREGAEGGSGGPIRGEEKERKRWGGEGRGGEEERRGKGGVKVHVYV